MKQEKQVMTNQSQFEAALAVASAEWSKGHFVCEASDRRLSAADGAASKCVPGVTDDVGEIEQAFRVLYHAISKAVEGKRFTSHLTPKTVFDNATWQCSLRDDATSIGFDVFTDGTRSVITTTWLT